MACAEIIDRRREAERLIGLDDRAEMIGIDPLILGEFEDQPAGRKAVSLAVWSVSWMQAMGE
jgi:hypothetical protein